MFRYAILRMDTEWKIVCARRRIGHFSTYDQALSVARALNDTRIFTAMAAELPDQLLAGADRSALWTARGAPRPTLQ